MNIAAIQTMWGTYGNTLMMSLCFIFGGIFVLRPRYIEGQMWFLPTLDKDDEEWLIMSIRVVGQFMIGTVLAPMLLMLWRWLILV